ncbi:DUF481 domain-containing protein [Vibrio sinaloensis]|uniref:DUF481 domain-containing protein n=1 Tax=Photobacterium sp. (strain ATCC 43367) TaxID=379097 RepID=UPI00206A33FB|nr:DUF481 domain-containing protein [Vibrio sinaloensis]UPQ88259.1 DUF481 domain-containing protein [Vibrio sinaloensis]
MLVYADDQGTVDAQSEPESPWKSEVEFGYQSHTGNSDSRALNSRLSAEYLKGRHRTHGEWKYYLLYKDGSEDKRQSTYSMQSDYKLGASTYLYGSFRGVDSLYSAYFKDYTLSGGLGYQLTNTDKLLVELELGPGFRYQEPNLDEIDDKDIVFPETVREAIFRGKLNASWKILDTLHASADITIVSGRSNTRTDSEISVTNNITEAIALSINHSRQYHDRVPDGLQKSDSIFSVNLLFVF